MAALAVYLTIVFVTCASGRSSANIKDLDSLLGSLLQERVEVPKTEDADVLQGTFQSRTALTEALLSHERYNPDVNPDVHNGPIVVEHSFVITNIVSLENEILTLQGFQGLTWRDERLKWNPDTSAGIKTLLIPDRLLWTPDIMLIDSATEFKGYRYDLNAEVYSDGKVLFEPPVYDKVVCPFLEEDLYLNNTVVCEMKFLSWTYDALMIDLQPQYQGLDTKYLMRKANRDWQLVSSSVKRTREEYDCCPDDPYLDLTYQIVLRRVA